MTMSAFLAAVRTHVFGSLVRGAWCRNQRRHLRAPGHPVVWVRGEAMLWAEWGARRGYFEVQHMNGMSYLSALVAPVA
jgi:hypothetical protein